MLSTTILCCSFPYEGILLQEMFVLNLLQQIFLFFQLVKKISYFKGKLLGSILIFNAYMKI